MLSGHEALARALFSARIRSAYSCSLPPLLRPRPLLDEKSAPSHRFVATENVAASLLLAGALLSGHPTAALMRQNEVTGALPTLSTYGMLNELRSAAVLIEVVDWAPAFARAALDNRGALSSLAPLFQLEAGLPGEVYQMTRLAAQASPKLGMPVLVRVDARTLDAKAGVPESPPDAPEAASMLFARSVGPFVSTSSTFRYHRDKRARLLHQLMPVVETLARRTFGDGNRAVVLAGTLSPAAHARAWSRGLSTLRLGASWPLPRQALLDLMNGRQELLVLEEGEPVLEREVQAFAQRESLACRVRGGGDARPQKLDEERLDTLLQRYGGPVRAEVDPVMRSTDEWTAVTDAIARLGEDYRAADVMEPWPLYFGRMRAKMKPGRSDDPRLALLKILRALPRPTIIAGDGAIATAHGITERLVDVGMESGSAAASAGALADAAEIEEQSGAPLAVALIGDGAHHHAELSGMLDNALARRQVLHVIVVARPSDTARLPTLGADALEAQLRHAGMHVASTSLDDPGLVSAVAYSASRHGARALICYGAPPEED